MRVAITDGTLTVVLNDDLYGTPAGIGGARFFPTAGDNETATDTIEVVYQGDPDDVLTNFQRLQRIFDRAEHAPGNVRRAWIEYRTRDEGINALVWRSPILSGRMTWGTTPELRQLYGAVGQGYVTGEVLVTVTRPDYWESEAGAQTTNGLKNGLTSPYNAAQYTILGGDLPSPMTVEIENSSGSMLEARNVYITTDAWAGMTGSQHLLTSGAGASSWGGATDHNTLRWILPIPAAVVAKLAGMSVNVIAAFSSLSDNVYVRAGLYADVDPTVFAFYQAVDLGGEKFASDRQLLNLGTLQIPSQVTDNLLVIISVYSPVAGAGTLSFVQLTPAPGMLTLSTMDWENGESFVHNGADNLAYYDTGAARFATVRANGGPLLLWPGLTNKVYVLFDEATTFTQARTFKVTISANSRRRIV